MYRYFSRCEKRRTQGMPPLRRRLHEPQFASQRCVQTGAYVRTVLCFASRRE